MNTDDFELINSLMEVLMQSRMWYRMTTDTPGLAAAQAELEALLDRVPADLRDSLEDAVNQNLARVEDAAVCYGLRVAWLLSAAAPLYAPPQKV